MQLFEILQREIGRGKSLAMATVVAKKGEGPMPVGGRMIVESSGLKWGTVGGGGIERAVIDTCLEFLTGPQRSELRHYDLTGSGVEHEDMISIPMICGGQVSIFYEVFRPQPVLLIFGGGNVGNALYQKMQGAGFSLMVCDPKLTPDIASKDHQPDHHVAIQSITETTYVVIATGDHEVDGDLLKGVLQLQLSLPYIGMLASKKKMAAIKAQLTLEGIHHWPKIYSPIGLKIGGETPDEIAISIAAQIIARRYGHLIIEDMDI